MAVTSAEDYGPFEEYVNKSMKIKEINVWAIFFSFQLSYETRVFLYATPLVFKN